MLVTINASTAAGKSKLAHLRAATAHRRTATIDINDYVHYARCIARKFHPWASKHLRGCEVSDLVSIIMIDWCHKKHGYDPAKSNPTTFLFCVARTAVMHAIETTKRQKNECPTRTISIDVPQFQHRSESSHSMLLTPADSAPPPPSLAAVREIHARIHSAISQLPPSWQRCVRGFMDGETQETTAAVLKVHRSRVRQLLQKAFVHLRESLGSVDIP